MSRPVIGRTAPPQLHVMSFNLRRAMGGPLRPQRDRWATRAPAVAALLSSERPTVLGLQEVLPRALRVVRGALGSDYQSLGHGRGGRGNGEGNPLLFDSSRMEMHSWGQRALSDRPDDPGSRGWGNLIPRILVWAIFAERTTGEHLLVVNTHLDHLSAHSRRRSASAIVALVRDYSLPAVVMGDLNAAPGSSAVLELTASGLLQDSWESAITRATPAWGTHSRYRAPRHGGARIDQILVTPELRVRTAAINARTVDSVHPSDHLAVHGVLEFEGHA